MKRNFKLILVVLSLALVVFAFTGCEQLEMLKDLLNLSCQHSGGTATCLEPAVCEKCGEAYGEALGHTEVADAAVSPTCTTTGLTAGKHCSVCNEPIVPQEEVAMLPHSYVNGVCSGCGAEEPIYDYYLVGYLNGADYGIVGDSANLGDYKFVDGKLTVTFTADSYVLVKAADANGENVKYYWAEEYVTGKTATLILDKTQKMLVPKNVEITFTLTVNADGTLTLVADYHVHSYDTVEVVAPTCTNKGYTKHICSCEDFYTDTETPTVDHEYDNDEDETCNNCEHVRDLTCDHDWIPATCTTPKTCSKCSEPEGTPLGHSYVDGICSECEAKDPEYVNYYLIGSINGADYGFEDDWANLGEYKFVNGKLTVTFTSASYVFVKSADLDGNIKVWYMAPEYTVGKETVLKNSDTDETSEKMRVPANVEVTFTLTENEDGTLTLVADYEEKIDSHTYTVAGNMTDTFGTAWDSANTANDMTYDEETGLWTKVYENVSVGGTYEFKICLDHGWTKSWGVGEGNYSITLAKGQTLTVTFDAATGTINATASGEGVKTYTIAGNSADTFGSAWDPANAANDMTYDEATGLWTKVYENVTVGGTHEFKICLDHTWTTSWGVGTDNYTIDVAAGQTLTVTFDPATGTINATVSGEGSGSEGGETETPTVYETVVYFKNTAGWTDVTVHTWSGSDPDTTWPGNAATLVENTTDWYSYTLRYTDATAIRFIFNNGGKGEQTGDLSLNPETPYLVFAEHQAVANAFATMEEAEKSLEGDDSGSEGGDSEDSFVPLNVYITGDIDGINWGKTDAGKMQPNEDGSVYSITLTFTKTTEFKFHSPTQDWVGYVSSGNMSVPAGTYTFYYHRDSDTFGWASSEALTDVPSVYVMGGMNGWAENDSWKLTPDASGRVYTGTFTVESDAEFKMKDSNGTWYGINPTNGGNVAIKAGTYTFTFYADSSTIAWTVVE